MAARNDKYQRRNGINLYIGSSRRWRNHYGKGISLELHRQRNVSGNGSGGESRSNYACRANNG